MNAYSVPVCEVDIFINSFLQMRKLLRRLRHLPLAQGYKLVNANMRISTKIYLNLVFVFIVLY